MAKKIKHRAADVARIRDELKCLSCSYELRGLAGDVVTCPECGRIHNVANLVLNHWNGRWYHAPGFKLLAMPLLAPIVWAFVMGVSGVIIISSNQTLFSWIFWLVTAAAVVLWVVLMVLALKRFERKIGILLTLMVQSIFPIYFIGLHALASIIFVIFMNMYDNVGIPNWVILVLAAIGGAMFVLAYFVQRLFARLCIRVHIRKLSDAGTDALTPALSQGERE